MEVKDRQNRMMPPLGWVLVTGAGRRLGAALSVRLLAEGYGVIGVYRHSSDEVMRLEALGAWMLQVDLTETVALQELIAHLQGLPALRAIVHNASLWLCDDQLLDDPDALQATYDLHVFTPYRLNEALAASLQRSSHGADIVFISDANVGSGKADKSLYLASKAAMESLMRSQAKKWAPTIKVNALAPGLLAFYPDDDEAYRQRRLANSLLGIEPGFGAAVDAVLFILSSNYMNATVLKLDGGR